MITLKEGLLNKKNIDKFINNVDYFNGRYDFLFIADHPEDFIKYIGYIGEPELSDSGTDGGVQYWIFSLEGLKKLINSAKYIYGNIYCYPIKTNDPDINKLSEIVDNWEYDDELNDWPRIPIDKLMTLKKK